MKRHAITLLVELAYIAYPFAMLLLVFGIVQVGELLSGLPSSLVFGTAYLVMLLIPFGFVHALLRDYRDEPFKSGPTG